MNFFRRLLTSHKRKSYRSQLLADDEKFSTLYIDPYNTDYYLYSSWVNIAINILIRNLARADFVIEKEGEEIKQGLFLIFFTGQIRT